MTQKPKKVVLFDVKSKQERLLSLGIAKYSQSVADHRWIFYTRNAAYFSSPDDKKALEQVLNWNVDSIFAIDSHINNNVLATGIPIIAIGIEECCPQVSNIMRDDQKIGQLGAEHLLDRGFTNLAYSGLDDMPWSGRREESFKETVRKAGFQTYTYQYPAVMIRQSWDQERPIMIEWLQSLPKPVGIMACNDQRGQYILDACMFLEIDVPNEVAVIGVDDDELCELTNPPLSSIAVDDITAGFEAAEVLDRMMETGRQEDKKIISRTNGVIARRSTDVLAVNDPVVTNAMKFIRSNPKRLIQVSEVLQEVCCSRTTLDEKFTSLFGRTVYKEIKRVRVTEIINMLINTNLSMSQIAYKMGFADAYHLSRYVKKVLGMSPRDYCKMHKRR